MSKYTDVIITINIEDYERAKKWNRNNGTTIQYVKGIGIHTKRDNDLENELYEIRKDLGIKQEDYVMISVGELTKRKNHIVILKALSKIPRSNIKYVIAGKGKLEFKLKQAIKQLNLEDEVILLGYRSDIRKILHASDCFVFPSLQEGLPVVIIRSYGRRTTCYLLKY